MLYCHNKIVKLSFAFRLRLEIWLVGPILQNTHWKKKNSQFIEVFGTSILRVYRKAWMSLQ